MRFLTILTDVFKRDNCVLIDFVFDDCLCYVWLHPGSGRGGEVGREVNHGMESIAPSLSPSSKTPATSMIVAPWEQKAQWKHRGTHRRRESRSEGERPHEEEGQLSDSAHNTPSKRRKSKLFIMKLFWPPPKQRLFG